MRMVLEWIGEHHTIAYVSGTIGFLAAFVLLRAGKQRQRWNYLSVNPKNHELNITFE